LQLGGDNYTLDYGYPEEFVSQDLFLARQHVPVILWGASVGPFEGDPVAAPELLSHLRGLVGVFVREARSRDYLLANGVTRNLHLVADPAFAMGARQPRTSQVHVPDGALGLNLSPLMANYVTGGDQRAWLDLCVAITTRLSEDCGLPIVLIPHDRRPGALNDDMRVLAEVASRMKPRDVRLVEVPLGAPEVKWVIGQCTVFVGARTHATIAAFSSGVPTLTLAYSFKASGINRDVYGDDKEYCLYPADITPERVTERVMRLLRNETTLRLRLASTSTLMTERALSAGPLLRKVMTEQLGIDPPPNV